MMSHPTDIMPADTALFSMSAESRASVARAILLPYVLPMALPIWRAFSGLRSLLAVPLTPLIPKSVIGRSNPLRVKKDVYRVGAALAGVGCLLERIQHPQ